MEPGGLAVVVVELVELVAGRVAETDEYMGVAEGE